MDPYHVDTAQAAAPYNVDTSQAPFSTLNPSAFHGQDNSMPGTMPMDGGYGYANPVVTGQGMPNAQQAAYSVRSPVAANQLGLPPRRTLIRMGCGLGCTLLASAAGAGVAMKGKRTVKRYFVGAGIGWGAAQVLRKALPRSSFGWAVATALVGGWIGGRFFATGKR